MKSIALTLLAAAAASPAAAQTAAPAPAAQASAPAAPAVGQTVLDTSGGTVGTIESVDAGVAVINTGSAKVGYPLTSMTPTPKGPIIALTKTQLEANAAEQATKAKAELDAKLVAGTPVRSVHGAAQLGTIKSADAEFVTLTTAKGDVRLARTAFSTDAQGVIVGLTAEQFSAAMGGKK